MRFLNNSPNNCGENHWLTKDCVLCSGALDHIIVTTKDGKFPLNQLGQISMKSPQLLVVNMTGFPEVWNQTTDGFLAELLSSYCFMQSQAHTPKTNSFSFWNLSVMDSFQPGFREIDWLLGEALCSWRTIET